MSGILAAALHVAVAGVCTAALARRWRGVENGLNPAWVGALWPLVAPLLAAYYAAATAYTVAAVLHGRRAQARRGDRTPRRTVHAPR